MHGCSRYVSGCWFLKYTNQSNVSGFWFLGLISNYKNVSGSWVLEISSCCIRNMFLGFGFWEISFKYQRKKKHKKILGFGFWKEGKVMFLGFGFSKEVEVMFLGVGF